MTTQTSVREKPIIFPIQDIRAILAGRMTQARRMAEPPKKAVFLPDDVWKNDIDEPGTAYLDDESGRLRITCPYGQPGDRLWVRETWATMSCYDYLKPSELSVNCDPWYYRADSEKDQWDDCERWRFALCMPRFVSRITLEITGVRFAQSHGGWWVISFRRIEA